MPPESSNLNEGARTGAAAARNRRRLLAALLAVLVLSGAAEVLYRAFWAVKGINFPPGGGDGYFSLYVVGESTAAGEPYAPGITLSALVRNLFGDRLQGREIKEFDLARSGDSVYPQAVALEQALRLRRGNAPGVVLIYAGHNDAMRPHGLAVLEWFREKVLYRSMLLGDLSFYAEKIFPFLRVRTRQNYEHQLRRIVEMSLESGLVPILTVVASNMADIDPGLFTDEAMDREGWKPLKHRLARAEMISILEKGLALEEQGRQGEAIRYYAAQAGAYPQMRSYLEYRTGKCSQAQGRYAEAGEFYRQAVDVSSFDSFPRATSRQKALIRELAKQYAVPLVDAVEIFEQNSPHGLLGSGLFSDGIHPNMTGYILLANAYAGKITGVFNAPAPRQWTGPEEVFRYFSYRKELQATALVTAGRFYFNIAAWHAWPVERLKLARARFLSALELDPDSFPAWIALAWTEVALRGSLLSDRASLYWLLKHGLLAYHSGPYGITPGQLPEVLEKLASYGSPDTMIAKIPRGAALKHGIRAGNGGEYTLTLGQLLKILKTLYNPAAAGGYRSGAARRG